MRDLETISLAITASETGHLVLATLHTTTASSTVDRIINAFPPDQQGQIRHDDRRLAEGRHLPDAASPPGRHGTGRGVRDPPQHPGGRGPDPRGKTFQIPTAIQTGGRVRDGPHGHVPAPARPGRDGRPARRLRPGAPQGSLRAVPARKAARRERAEPSAPRETLEKVSRGRSLSTPSPPERTGSTGFSRSCPSATARTSTSPSGSPPVLRMDGELETHPLPRADGGGLLQPRRADHARRASGSHSRRPETWTSPTRWGARRGSGSTSSGRSAARPPSSGSSPRASRRSRSWICPRPIVGLSRRPRGGSSS